MDLIPPTVPAALKNEGTGLSDIYYVLLDPVICVKLVSQSKWAKG